MGARTAAAMVPGSVLEQATWEWRGAEGGELPGGAVREHLALQTHLSAMEAFNDWFEHFHKGQPVRPVLAEGSSFTEKVAHEQRERVAQQNQRICPCGHGEGKRCLGLCKALSTIKEIMAMCWLRNMLFPYHGNPISGHAHFSKPGFPLRRSDLS